MASEKQIALLIKAGHTRDEIDKMPYQQVSDNIKAFLNKDKAPPVKENPATPYIDAKHAAMYTSYAKDVFVALLAHTKGQEADNVTMSRAVDIINHAKRAFTE